MTADAADDAALREAADGFFLAAEHGRSDVIKALADHGEGKLDLARIVDAKTGRTPLHVAVAHHKTDALRVLLAAGFPPQIEAVAAASPSHQKRTAYAMAVDARAHDLVFVFHQFAIQQVAMDCAQGVAQLLAAGVPLDVADGAATGNTLLHWAVTCRALAVAKFLLESEQPNAAALVDHVNAEGTTPLHIACRDGKLDFVRLLLDHGADPRCTGTGGFCKDKTPLDLVTSTEIRALVTTHEERLHAAQLRAERGESDKVTSMTSEGSDQDDGCVEALVAVRRKHALQMEEKDLLIRQLKTTIETLVVESQEIRKLGEERTVLDYVRKLREEKDVVRRQLEDAEDHIRIQQQQIQELKRQIRTMQQQQQQEQTPGASGGRVASVQRAHSPLAGPSEDRKDTTTDGDAESRDTVRDALPTLQIDSTPPRSQRSRKATPTRSGSGAWNDVWTVLWGNGLQADDVEADGEVIMTV